MGAATQNRLIARLIVGGMSIDGSLDKKEQEKAVRTLSKLGMDELIADFGAAVDADDGSFNVFKECRELVESLGTSAKQVAPMIFRVIAEVLSSDRFISINEATYLSGVAKRLDLTTEQAKQILKEVMVKTRGRLEVAGAGVSAEINPHLKELLSFEGADELVGELDNDSLQEMLSSAQAGMQEGERVSLDEVERALAVLGLSGNAKLKDAETVWRETIDNLNLPKMADLGETFVSAAIQRIQTINNAYKTVLQFETGMKKPR